ncbi:MAG TPA: hypothetical protein VKH82_01060 [Candidatus Binatia bacterium]|nr:hypothetical protein [Candidatus Binatia bacterium]
MALFDCPTRLLKLKLVTAVLVDILVLRVDVALVIVATSATIADENLTSSACRQRWPR